MQALTAQQRRQLSLSVRVSLCFILAAILPLLFIIAFSEWQGRPALMARANVAMESDARARVQLIDTYFNERLLDAQTLGQVPSVQEFLAAPPGNPDLALHATYALVAGSFRDKNYAAWSLFDSDGHLRLSYPNAPQSHGEYLVPPENAQAVTAGKTFISAVYFDPTTQKTSVDIYSPIIASSAKTPLGFVRATLNLNYIMNIVHEDRGNNGSGSYAFLLDQDGVRIAGTEAAQHLTAVAPLASEIQNRISKEARYGTNEPVPVLPDSAFAQRYQHTSSPSTFQTTPAGKSETFQVVQRSTKTVPWNYFVLSPMSTVTAVANQQLLVTSIIAAAMIVLAAILGLIVGRRITYPILSSVEALRGSSESLSALATRQKNAAFEQMWVVDSSQVGLQSIQYYTDATQSAAQQLREVGLDLARNLRYIAPNCAMQRLERIVVNARYIENATRYQAASNQNLATALKVAIQVTEQLATGATSATEASRQLEQVVDQLRQVVGR